MIRDSIFERACFTNVEKLVRSPTRGLDGTLREYINRADGVEDSIEWKDLKTITPAPTVEFCTRNFSHVGSTKYIHP